MVSHLQPLITVCGTTAVGKSNLAVELALRLAQGGFVKGWKGAKIINADSMQVYSGLDVITNKIPEEERKGVDHLLMGFKKPGEQYVVGEWVQDALELVCYAVPELLHHDLIHTLSRFKIFTSEKKSLLL